MANGSGEVQRTADACVARMRQTADGMAGCSAEWSALVEAVRTLDPRYAFETEGRESALQAVRHALPSMERELFDAIVEDHACEVAALREAVNQLLRAGGKSA